MSNGRVEDLGLDGLDSQDPDAHRSALEQKKSNAKKKLGFFAKLFHKKKDDGQPRLQQPQQQQQQQQSSISHVNGSSSSSFAPAVEASEESRRSSEPVLVELQQNPQHNNNINPASAAAASAAADVDVDVIADKEEAGASAPTPGGDLSEEEQAIASQQDIPSGKKAKLVMQMLLKKKAVAENKQPVEVELQSHGAPEEQDDVSLSLVKGNVAAPAAAAAAAGAPVSKENSVSVSNNSQKKSGKPKEAQAGPAEVGAAAMDENSVSASASEKGMGVEVSMSEQQGSEFSLSSPAEVGSSPAAAGAKPDKSKLKMNAKSVFALMRQKQALEEKKKAEQLQSVPENFSEHEEAADVAELMALRSEMQGGNNLDSKTREFKNGKVDASKGANSNNLNSPIDSLVVAPAVSVPIDPNAFLSVKKLYNYRIKPMPLQYFDSKVYQDPEPKRSLFQVLRLAIDQKVDAKQNKKMFSRFFSKKKQEVSAEDIQRAVIRAKEKFFQLVNRRRQCNDERAENFVRLLANHAVEQAEAKMKQDKLQSTADWFLESYFQPALSFIVEASANLPATSPSSSSADPLVAYEASKKHRIAVVNSVTRKLNKNSAKQAFLALRAQQMSSQVSAQLVLSADNSQPQEAEEDDSSAATAAAAAGGVQQYPLLDQSEPNAYASADDEDSPSLSMILEEEEHHSARIRADRASNQKFLADRMAAAQPRGVAAVSPEIRFYMNDLIGAIEQQVMHEPNHDVDPLSVQFYTTVAPDVRDAVTSTLHSIICKIEDNHAREQALVTNAASASNKSSSSASASAGGKRSKHIHHDHKHSGGANLHVQPWGPKDDKLAQQRHELLRTPSTRRRSPNFTDQCSTYAGIWKKMSGWGRRQFANMQPVHLLVQHLQSCMIGELGNNITSKLVSSAEWEEAIVEWDLLKTRGEKEARKNRALLYSLDIAMKLDRNSTDPESDGIGLVSGQEYPPRTEDALNKFCIALENIVHESQVINCLDDEVTIMEQVGNLISHAELDAQRDQEEENEVYDFLMDQLRVVETEDVLSSIISRVEYDIYTAMGQPVPAVSKSGTAESLLSTAFGGQRTPRAFGANRERSYSGSAPAAGGWSQYIKAEDEEEAPAPVKKDSVMAALRQTQRESANALNDKGWQTLCAYQVFPKFFEPARLQSSLNNLESARDLVTYNAHGERDVSLYESDEDDVEIEDDVHSVISSCGLPKSVAEVLDAENIKVSQMLTWNEKQCKDKVGSLHYRALFNYLKKLNKKQAKQKKIERKGTFKQLKREVPSRLSSLFDMIGVPPRVTDAFISHGVLVSDLANIRDNQIRAITAKIKSPAAERKLLNFLSDYRSVISSQLDRIRAEEEEMLHDDTIRGYGEYQNVMMHEYEQERIYQQQLKQLKQQTRAKNAHLYDSGAGLASAPGDVANAAAAAAGDDDDDELLAGDSIIGSAAVSDLTIKNEALRRLHQTTDVDGGGSRIAAASLQDPSDMGLKKYDLLWRVVQRGHHSVHELLSVTNKPTDNALNTGDTYADTLETIQHTSFLDTAATSYLGPEKEGPDHPQAAYDQESSSSSGTGSGADGSADYDSNDCDDIREDIVGAAAKKATYKIVDADFVPPSTTYQSNNSRTCEPSNCIIS